MSGIALRLELVDKGADGLGVLRQKQRGTSTERLGTFARHTTQTMASQQAFKGIEQSQL